MATQARSNIAVSNDCISNVFTPNVVVTIQDVDRSTAIRISSIRITLNRNEVPDDASFIVNRDGGFTPTVGQKVGIGLGDSGNFLFAGQIMHVRHLREKVTDTPDYEVVCTDWTPLFNRRLITRDFSGDSATAIAHYIVEDYTSGFHGNDGFYTYGIGSSLATIDEFICINEEPLAALRRLANILGGGCRVDANRIVHLWDSSGPSVAYTPSPPATLTNSLSTLKDFTPEYDWSQIRTRVIVEGKQTTCPLSIPADVTLPGNSLLPVEDSSYFSASGGSARVGTNVVTYTSRNYPVVAGLNAEGSHVTVDAAAGSTSVTIDDSSWVLSTGTFWCQIGDQIVYFGAASGGPDQLTSIPASGFGSLQHGVGAGDNVRALGMLVGVSGLTTAQDAGVEVVVRAEEDDAAAQAAVTAVEGGDGIHEFLVVDGRLSDTGVIERAQAELDTFGAALTRATWVTHDMQAVPGAEQVINLTSPDTISATLMIDTVSIDFQVDVTRIATSPTSACASNLWPRRVCQGSTVKLATVFDAISRG